MLVVRTERVELAQLFAAIRVAQPRRAGQVVDIGLEDATRERVVAHATEAVEAAGDDLVARARPHEPADGVVLVAVLWDRHAAGAGFGLERGEAAGGIEGVTQLCAVGPGDLRQVALRIVVIGDLPAVRHGQGAHAAEQVMLELRRGAGRVRSAAWATGKVEVWSVYEVEAAGVDVRAHRLAEQAEAVAGQGRRGGRCCSIRRSRASYRKCAARPTAAACGSGARGRHARARWRARAGRRGPGPPR
jgi:hypothetical protein